MSKSALQGITLPVRAFEDTGQHGNHSPTALVEAISRQRTDTIAEILADKLAPISREELDGALMLAAALGQAPVCRLLLQAGADPCATEHPHEHAQRHGAHPPAFSSRHAHAQAWLAQHTSVGGTALHRAAENNQLDCAKLLLEKLTNVNAADKYGVTPLMVSCMCASGQEMTCVLVTTPGCDVSATDLKHGRSALHYAAQMGNAASVKLLINAGADVDCQDRHQTTPLILATTPFHSHTEGEAEGALACMTLLLEAHCFVNLFNKDSHTALHQAVEAHSREAVKLLLKNGALVHPEIIRDACLVLGDEAILRLLLTRDQSLHDDFLLFLLVALVVTEPSCWMLNNKEQQNRLHLASRYLLQRIHDVNSLNYRVFTMSQAELENLYGEDFASQFKESVRNDLESLGLFGLALRYGKYGVAKMLHAAGYDVTLMRMIKDSEAGQYLQGHQQLKQWLPQVLNSPASLKTQARQICRSMGLFGQRLHDDFPKELKDFLELQDLESIDAHDALIQEVEETLLDQSYSDREKAKAAKEQLLWLYNV